MRLYEINYPVETDTFTYGQPVWIYQNSSSPEEAYIGIYKNDIDNVKAQVYKFSNNFWRMIIIHKNRIAKRTVNFDEELYNLRKNLVVSENIKFVLPTDRMGDLKLTNGIRKTTL
ncbi:MAG: hypothetical protein KC414_03490 [Romboutsia sp.]|nr:hypothetical protein [Romboutsia sp.]